MFKHKGSDGRGEYIKITGMVIAFYINVLLEVFPSVKVPF